ncbi:DUF5337 domain-containing protein [Shimia biformata]|uniref:DUF5337 domain-containing protein n=1 Tax=Shimia biformata TaxID=1294299 RepID=UPI00194EFA6A|nr:DUF5337 domain-containing protein [Shimia biformata]
MTRTETDLAIAKRGRVVALVIAGAMILWMAAQFVGGKYDLPGRYALLIDFAAIAALIWALVNIFWIWRARQQDKG